MNNILWFIKAWLGLNPDLPFAKDVENPKHGQEAKNSRSQKVIYDEKQRNNKTGEMGKWVMPQAFSDRKPVTITGGRRK
jgi:hypothetical protein